MQIFSTDIFRNFFCKGSKCKDNCCKIGWDIEIDQKTYDFYKSLDNDLGRKIISHIYEDSGCRYMKQKNGCQFMNENGLCSIQLKYGEENISDICREHPRFYEWFGDYKEAGVGICCEKVCEMLLEHPTPIEFYTFDTDEETDDLFFDDFVLEKTLEVRNHIINILQNRDFSITQRLEFLKKCGENMQAAVDSEDEDIFYEICKDICEKSHEEIIEKKEFYINFSKKILNEITEFDFMHNEFLNAAKKALENTEKIIKTQINEFDFIWEHLAVYFTFRYFIKAVRDFDFSQKTNYILKSITAIYLVLGEIKIEKNTLSKEDFIFAIKEYSKEIEYSDNDF